MAEEGFFQPGTVVVGNDSHTCTGGAFGTLSLGVGTTSIGCAAATGKVWVKVPESVKVTWDGDLPPLVTPKDMALFAIGEFGSNRMIYKAVEHEGSCIHNLSMAGRMALANMSVEMGAKIGIMAPDQKTREYVKRNVPEAVWDLKADPDAVYEEEFRWDASALEPMVAVPHHVSNVQRVRDVAGMKVDQAYVGSCTGGRYEDIEAAAKILKGKKIPSGVNLIVCPASKWIWEKASRDGTLADLSEAGAMVSYPSCGPCGAAQGGLLAAGEVCISATNRNFKGRMGSTEAGVYLASPVTVAASALAGEIIDPRDL
jgi:3-isopropylmalate/(R)-2-methylmalate dehydratase large subunit